MSFSELWSESETETVAAAGISTAAGESCSGSSATGKGLKAWVVEEEEESKGWWPRALRIWAKIWKKKANQLRSVRHSWRERGEYTSGWVNSAIGMDTQTNKQTVFSLSLSLSLACTLWERKREWLGFVWGALDINALFLALL